MREIMVCIIDPQMVSKSLSFINSKAGPHEKNLLRIVLCDCYRVDSAGAENLDGADQRMCGGRYCFSVYSKDFTPAVCRILSSISSALG